MPWSWPLFPSLCLLPWHHPWWRDLSSIALMLSCEMTLPLKPPWVTSYYLATHQIGDVHLSRGSISCRYGLNTGSFWTCSCSRPNPSSWNIFDPLWNIAHKVTWGCSPMEYQYFGLEGSHKLQHLGVYHLLSPCCHHQSVALDGHHCQLPCQMLQRPMIWMH